MIIETDKIYSWREADQISLVNLHPALQDAVFMVDEDRLKFRDEGTCVLGAGIAVWVKERYARNSSVRILIRAPFQGNVGSAKSCDRALAYLKEQGIAAFWHDGVMD